MNAFSEGELELLARPWRVRLVASLEDYDGSASAEVVRSALATYRHCVAGYYVWASTIHAWMLAAHGEAGLRLLAEATVDFAARAESDDGSEPALDDVLAFVAASTPDAVLARYDECETWYRNRHDIALDYVSALLSAVFNTYGFAELSAAFRAIGTQTLLPWMRRDIDLEIRDRLRRWTTLLLGNFTELAITEQPDRVTIIQNPCGSCSRQLLRGYPGRFELASVARVRRDGHQATKPVYREHVEVIHHLMPIEEIGVPWPVIRCPAGMLSGPCTITLFKEPLNPAAWTESVFGPDEVHAP